VERGEWEGGERLGVCGKMGYWGGNAAPHEERLAPQRIADKNLPESRHRPEKRKSSFKRKDTAKMHEQSNESVFQKGRRCRKSGRVAEKLGEVRAPCPHKPRTTRALLPE